jgi:hypothetical protein
MTSDETMPLYRPVGQKELDLIRESGWRSFPPRLDWQPIFYPVLSEEYAVKIARDWNTKDPNSDQVGYVLRFKVRKEYIDQFEPHEAGGRELQEYWIPSERLDEFNANIVGTIDILHEFRGEGEAPKP